MALRKILKYSFSLLLLIIVVKAGAQKQTWQGISLGFDLSKVAMPLFDSTKLGWEAVADYEIIPDMFGAVELGSQATNFSTRNYSYSSAGAYTRFGVDYNFMKHLDETSTDKMFIGLRYAFTTFYQQADNIRLRDEIWGEYTNGKVPRNWMSSNWLEVALGMRANLINNFYLGWSARIKILIGSGKDTKMQPYDIPGYGRANKNNAFGINYSLYYMIPVKKKRVATKEEKQP